MDLGDANRSPPGIGLLWAESCFDQQQAARCDAYGDGAGGQNGCGGASVGSLAANHSETSAFHTRPPENFQMSFRGEEAARGAGKSFDW